MNRGPAWPSDDCLSETSAIFWIHGGALTNQRCSLVTGVGLILCTCYTYIMCRFCYTADHIGYTYTWTNGHLNKCAYESLHNSNLESPIIKVAIFGHLVSCEKQLWSIASCTLFTDHCWEFVWKWKHIIVHITHILFHQLRNLMPQIRNAVIDHEKRVMFTLNYTYFAYAFWSNVDQ